MFPQFSAWGDALTEWLAGRLDFQEKEEGMEPESKALLNQKNSSK